MYWDFYCIIFIFILNFIKIYKNFLFKIYLYIYIYNDKDVYRNKYLLKRILVFIFII